MMHIRRGSERGVLRNHWLDARLSFSFGAWRDPVYDGWSDLLVFNDDRVAPGQGFAEHGHADVEVMSYPLAGAVEHRDSLGHHTLMQPGDVHLMRAGRGIRHSEMNASSTEPEHHLQWWIRPARRGLDPAYQRIHVSDAEKTGRWRLIAAPEVLPGVLHLAQDTRVFVARPLEKTLPYRVAADRSAYLHVTRGALRVNGVLLEAGDAVLATDHMLSPTPAAPGAPAELLLIDLRRDATLRPAPDAP